MTYKQLAEKIAKMTPEQKDQSVTIFLSGIVELFEPEGIMIITEDDEVCSNGFVDSGTVVLEVIDGNN